MDGQEHEALDVLANSNLEEAIRLCQLIRKPVIQILAQTVWEEDAFQDSKFQVHRTGIHRNRANQDGVLEPDYRKLKEPFLSIQNKLAIQPDLYFAHMIEWQYLPYDLASLNCPTFGLTSDVDLHIQNNLPWMDTFDEVITVGAEEWAKARQLRSGPTSTFPKLFGVPSSMPALANQARDVDVFISGTLLSPYHPDKAALMQQLLRTDDLHIRYMNGFLPPDKYAEELMRAKVAFTYVRHPGSMPSRGVEALAAGCAVLTQPNSALTLYAGESEGVYSNPPDQLVEGIRRLVHDWPTVADQARRGAELMRHEFSGDRCISQFLRYLTVRAAMMGSQRHRLAPENPHQKRVIAHRGWTYPSTVNHRLQQHTLEECTAMEAIDPNPRNAINAARELDLFIASDLQRISGKISGFHHANTPESEDVPSPETVQTLGKEMREQALTIYRHGMVQHPDSLVLLFNFIRHCLHFGSPELADEALTLIQEILESPDRFQHMDPLEDVQPWDYFGTLFNYRTYFDLLTSGLGTGELDQSKARQLVMASLSHYLGQYTADVPRLEQAVQWDPQFAHYKYSLAQSLLLRRHPDDIQRATDILIELFNTSLLIEPAFRLLAAAKEAHGIEIEHWGSYEFQFRQLKQMSFASDQAFTGFEHDKLILPSSLNALPLQRNPFQSDALPVAGSNVSAHASPYTGDSPTPDNVLLVSFECGNWENARAWTYNGFYALEEALGTQNVRHLTLPAIAGISSSHRGSWLRQAKLFTQGKTYDQVWIWITHNEYDPEFLDWLETVAPVRIGVIMESLDHTETEAAQLSHLNTRRGKVLEHLRCCTHALTFDERDAETLTSDLPLKTLWCPPVVGWRDICPNVVEVDAGPAWFQGTAYNPERRSFLNAPSLENLLINPPSPEADSLLPEEFDAIQIQSIEQLMSYDTVATEWLDQYLEQLRRVRRHLNDLWQSNLRRGFAHVNLPSIYKGYAGRVVESMAAGRPVISWKPPRKRTQALFTPGEEILWFNRESPEELADQIRYLQTHPEQALAIAERARQKVLRYHTAETRIRQILEWIANGTEPDYGEQDTLTQSTHSTHTDMNEPSHPKIDTLEAALELAEACNERNDRPGAIQAMSRAVELGDRHPVLLRALGTQHYLAEHHEEASALFREFTENCPDDATGHVQLALATYHTGDEMGCEVALQQALVLEPNHPEALKLSADLDVRHERYDKAQEKYDRIADSGGITVDALHALAFCQFKSGDVERAENTYQQLLSFNADDELAQANLNTIVQMQEPAEPQPVVDPTAEFLEQADFFQQAGNPEAALAELEQAVNREPQNPKFREALGSLLYQQDRTEEARRQFRRLIELQPQNAMAYTRLAMASYATERFDEFESALGLAMELDPNLPEMLHFFGKVNLDQDRYYDAGRIFSKLVELEPDKPENLLALGVCLFHGDQVEAAQQTFERVLQMDPNNAIAQGNLDALANDHAPTLEIPENLPTSEPEVTEEAEPLSHRTLKDAQAALEQGDPQQAIDLLQSVLAEHPNEVPVLNALANLLLQAGLHTEAANYFQQLATLNPEDVAPRLQAATASLLGGEIGMFESNMEKALELDPTNPHGLKLLATANFKAGKYREAADIYHQALPGLPEDIEIVLALGVCFHNLNSPEGAKDCFERALEIDPQNELAAENLKALNVEPVENTETNSQVSAKVLEDLRAAQAPNPEANDTQSDLPATALVGNLDRAQTLLAEGRHLESWQETLHALELRPFHPEAYLHLAEIALDAGDYAQAMVCLSRLTTLTPEWEVPQQALNSLRQGAAPTGTGQIDWPALPDIPDTPRLSVCLIVKNEEQFLPKALQSIQPHAHQIVVLDTGSTDRTVALAKEHGAEVHTFDWCDDFAAARNAALEHARGDWVLVLDADEVLPADEVAHLQADLQGNNLLGYRLPLINKIMTADGGDETADGQCHVPRLFRNAPGLHFVGRVHEQVYSSVLLRQLDWQMDSAIGNTTLHHFGYTPEVKQQRDKVKRNLRLLEKAVEEQPAEATLLMNYALDLFNDGQFEAALDKDREAFRLLSELPAADVLPEIRERLVSIFCYHLLQAELYEELAEVAASPLSRDCGPTASIHYVHGLALLKLGQPGEAIGPFRECILKRDEPVYTARFKGVEDHGPHHLLADCYAQADQPEAARAEYDEALKRSPEATIVRWGYARFLTEQELPDEAIQLLFGAIENGSIDSRLWALGCHIVNGHLNDTEVAQRWTECAIDADPEDAEIRKQRGIALLTVGQFQEAQEYFEKAARHPLNEGARILCQVATGQTPSPLSDPDKEILISTAFMEWFRRLIERGQEAAARKVADQHETLAPVLPTAAEMLQELMVADQ